jgi:hypothetical protein
MALDKTIGNIGSVPESSTTLIFPAESRVRASIPLFMKFYCLEYNNSALSRAAAVPSVTGSSIPGLNKLKTSIIVPAPPQFKASTSLPYTAEDMIPGSNIYETLYNLLVPNTVKSGVSTATGMVEDALLLGTQLGNSLMGAAGFGQNIQTDLKELTFKGGNGTYRSFDVRLYMPCLSIEDSMAASNIIKSFEALSLPTILSILSLRSTHFFHPPLWIFGIGPLASVKFDREWSGYPQLCVLTNVDVRRSAFETESLSAISDGSGQFKPVAYSVSLGFRELEPSVRQTNPFGETSTAIVSRSAAILTAGTRIPSVNVTGE